jgi:hypothetical protein
MKTTTAGPLFGTIQRVAAQQRCVGAMAKVIRSNDLGCYAFIRQYDGAM